MSLVARRHGLDLLLCAALALVCAIRAHSLGRAIDPALLSYETAGVRTTDVWFDGDVPKTVRLMTDRFAEQHAATAEHPLASLVMFGAARAVRAVTGLAPLPAALLVMPLVSGMWTALTFVLLRLLGCTTLDASLFTILGIVSAAMTFWSALPELFLPGSVTILLALLVIVKRRPQSTLWAVAATVVSLSMTVTNGMVGLFGTVWSRGWRRAIAVVALALVVLSAAWGLERALFPEAAFFVGSGRVGQFVFLRNPLNAARAASAMLSDVIVMPDVRVIEREPTWHVLSVQRSWPGSSGVIAGVGVTAWIAVILVGARVAWRRDARPAWLRLVVALAMAQIGLHVLFGAETFLYVAHILPLLILIGAAGTLTAGRNIVRALVVVVIICAAVTNTLQFQHAADLARAIAEAARDVRPT